MALNQFQVSGRLTKDPVLSETTSGIHVCSFTIACDRDFKEADGTRGTDFFNCVAWRERAEFISKYFTKGSTIILVGKLRSRNYMDKDGAKRQSTELIVDNAYFGSPKKPDAPAPEAADSCEPPEEDFPF